MRVTPFVVLVPGVFCENGPGDGVAQIASSEGPACPEGGALGVDIVLWFAHLYAQ